MLLLLASVCFVVVTGLFSAGDEGPGGPLAGRFGWDLSGLHEPAFRVLQGVVALHLLGVLVTSMVNRDNLVAAMIIGSKRRRLHATPAPTRRGSTGGLVVAVVLAASASAYLMSLPLSNSGGAALQTRGERHRTASFHSDGE